MPPKEYNKCNHICHGCGMCDRNRPKSLVELKAEENRIKLAMSEGQRALNKLQKEIQTVKARCVEMKLCRVWRDRQYNEIEDGVTIRLIKYYDPSCQRYIDAHDTKWMNAEPVTYEEVKQYLL
jgi:hypothetical protein